MSNRNKQYLQSFLVGIALFAIFCLWSRVSLKDVCNGTVKGMSYVALGEEESKIWVPSGEIRLDSLEVTRLFALLAAGHLTNDCGACIQYGYALGEPGKQLASLSYTFNVIPEWMDHVFLRSIGKFFSYNIYLEYHPATGSAMLNDCSICFLNDIEFENVLVVSNVPPELIHLNVEDYRTRVEAAGYEDWRFRGSKVQKKESCVTRDL